ncbi:MAG: Uma2 family endonuclease [Chloroflexota bacterium]
MAIARRGPIAGERLTLEEFLRLPEAKPPYEYWHGEVTQKVSPLGPHIALQSGIPVLIARLAVAGQPVRAFPEARLIFSGVTTVPDLVVYRRERIPRDARGQVAEYFRTPPDVVVEIVSPGQSRTKLLARCRWYAANGIRLAVFADPRRRIVRLFRPDADSGDLRGADQLDLTDVLPGFTLSVDDFFAPLSADWE